MLKTAVTALTIVMLASFACVAEEIEPARKISGKIADPALKVFRPPTGIVTDTTTWRKLWGAWRPTEPLEDVDFNEQMVLIETANGPNTVIASPLQLDEQGKLKYEVASTAMAGPGFGYLMLIIPKHHIESVNGRGVPEPNADDKPELESDPVAAESITVEINGRIRTGVMAIGGETTGVLVAANGIVWELDLQDDEQLIEAAQGLGRSVGQIRGTLKKQTGVEIRDRWIVTVESIAELGQKPVGQTEDTIGQADKSMPQEVPSKPEEQTKNAPVEKSFNSISISSSGGIAGVEASQTIKPDGSVKYENARQNISDTWTIDPATLSRLHQFVGQTDWEQVPKVTRAENVADAFGFSISIETPQGVTRVFIDGPSIPTQPVIQELFAIIRRPPATK